jgi:ABC-type bacteriocin/lantibiotic exporter with double-glycine peptidase domain
LAPLIGVWVAFGLFIIAASALVAWFADRLAHQRRNMVLADYFEHVLQLPLAYHSGAHSGRQMKVMLTGTDTLWWLWVSFFREHFAAFVFIALLLPTSLYLNWRLALPLLVRCVANVLVMHKAFALQRTVEQHYSDLAESRRCARQCGAGAKLRPHRDRGHEPQEPGGLTLARAYAGCDASPSWRSASGRTCSRSCLRAIV